MATITLYANTRASSAAASNLHFSALPNAKLAYEPTILPPLTSLKITGTLPGGRRLAQPLEVMIEYDDGEVIVSEPYFHIHASAHTRVDALGAFRRVFSKYLDVLSSRESRLDPYLREQLAYLRSYITTAE
jgi:hypothetical protein